MLIFLNKCSVVVCTLKINGTSLAHFGHNFNRVTVAMESSHVICVHTFVFIWTYNELWQKHV